MALPSLSYGSRLFSYFYIRSDEQVRADEKHALRLAEAVEEAVFKAHDAPLRALYQQLCASDIAAYPQQLRVLRRLLPQHIGVQPALALGQADSLGRGGNQVTSHAILDAASTRTAMYAFRPPPRALPDASGEGERLVAAAALHERRAQRAAWLVQTAWRGWAGGPYARAITALRGISTCNTPLQKAQCALSVLSLVALEAAERQVAAQRAAAGRAAAERAVERQAAAARAAARRAAAAREAAELLARYHSGGQIPLQSGTADESQDSTEAISAGETEGEISVGPISAAEIAADDLLPLLVFVLVRARVPELPSQVRAPTLLTLDSIALNELLVYFQVRFLADFLPRSCSMGELGYAAATLQACFSTSW